MVSRPLEALSQESFSPYGTVLSSPLRASDADGPGWQWWGEVAHLPSDGRRWAFGYLVLEPAPTTFDWAERHMRSSEVVLATASDIAVYVAPPTASDAPSLDEFQVFALRPGSGVVLDPGVWHGAPLALGKQSTSALVLLLEGTGRHDVTVARFPDSPVTVEQRADVTAFKPSEEVIRNG